MVRVSQLPRFALRDGLNLFGPQILQDSSSPTIAVGIYGFSGKSQYDQFLGHDLRLLTPYPLVKGYLRNQIDLAADALSLVVLDATDPAQVTMVAATMQAISDALNKNFDSVEATHQLNWDVPSSSFRCGLIHAETSGNETVCS